MKITFVRHGQTDFNKEGKVQGQRIDPPLNQTGIEQAKQAQQLLSDNFDVIISSPLQRALQTAKIINEKYNKEIFINDLLKELDYGILSGKTWLEIEDITKDPDVHAKDITSQYNYHAYEGESAEDVKARFQRFIQEVKKNWNNKKILVATHGGVIEAGQALVYGRVNQEATYCEIIELDF